jgi:hypothetical protein
MAELVDALVSGTSAARRGGSSPLLGTKAASKLLIHFKFLTNLENQPVSLVHIGGPHGIRMTDPQSSGLYPCSLPMGMILRVLVGLPAKVQVIDVLNELVGILGAHRVEQRIELGRSHKRTTRTPDVR